MEDMSIPGLSLAAELDKDDRMVEDTEMHEGEASSGEYSDEEPVEIAVLARSKRDNAGTKMRALLDQEQQLEAEEIFAEEENDVDFVGKEEADVFDSDFQETSSDNGEDDEDAVEKQIRRDERRARRAEREKQTQRTAAKPSFDYEKSSLARKRDRERALYRQTWELAQERKRKRYSPSYQPEQTRERVSSRRTAVTFKAAVESRLAEENSRVREKMADERLQAKREVARKKRYKVWGQTELVEEALQTEERNKASLAAFYKMEEERREIQTGLTGYAVYGPRMMLLSTTRGIGRKSELLPAEPPVRVLQTASNLPHNMVNMPGASSIAQTGESLVNGSGHTISATAPTSLARLSNKDGQDASTNGVSSQAAMGVDISSPQGMKEPQKQPYMKNVLLLADLHLLEGTDKEETYYAIFGEHCDWLNARIVPAKNRPAVRKPTLCPITGLPARYKEPKTNIPYANKTAYDVIQRLYAKPTESAPGFVWSPEFRSFLREAPSTGPKTLPDPPTEVILQELTPLAPKASASRGTKRASYVPNSTAGPSRRPPISVYAESAEEYAPAKSKSNKGKGRVSDIVDDRAGMPVSASKKGKGKKAARTLAKVETEDEKAPTPKPRGAPRDRSGLSVT